MIDLTGNDDDDRAGIMAAAAPTPSPPPMVAVDVAPVVEFNADPLKLSSTLSQLYESFLHTHRENVMLNNVDGNQLINFGTIKHRHVMNEIGAHFMDNSPDRVVEPDIVQYLFSADVNKMNCFDRIRMHLIALEYERGRFHAQKMRLKRKRGGMLTDEMACPVCLLKIVPNVNVDILECGHVLCETCLNGILDNDNLRDACPVCRVNIDREEDMNRIHFKFNYDNEPICRYCEVPFRQNDGSECMALACSHAFHENCLTQIDNNCCTCNNIIGGGRTHAFLHFE